MILRNKIQPQDEALVEIYVAAEQAAARIVGAAASEDVASETLIRALCRWPRIAGYARSWAVRVATNLAIDQLRKKHPVGVSTAGRLLEDDIVDREVIVAELRRLSRRQGQALALRYLLGLSESDTAAVMGVSVDTVKTHTRQGMRTVRSRLLSAQEVPRGTAS